MDFLKSIGDRRLGLRAQAGRMRVLSENLANADSTAQAPDSDPFLRKIPDVSLGGRPLGSMRA